MQLSLLDGDRLVCPVLTPETPALSALLFVYAQVAHLSNDDMPLIAYGIQDGFTIHVNDLDPNSLSKNGGLEDVSQIEKYRMSEDEYDKRENTLRSWKRKLLQTDPERAQKLFPSLRPHVPDGAAPVEDLASVEGIEVGLRCECSPGARRGTVAYVGEVLALGLGYWVGVKFDEPVGKSSGTLGTKVVFEAAPGYGGFLRGYNVTTGDFPVVDDLGLSDGEDDGEEATPALAGASTPVEAPAAAAAAATAATGSAPTPSVREEGLGKYVPGSKSSGLRVVRRGGGAEEEDSDDNDDEL
jgi:tubulin-folding cofactor B